MRILARHLPALLPAFLLVLVALPVQAGGVIHTSWGKAIDGYDPVAYFAIGGGKPAKGSKEREVAFRGVRYRFATVKNRELFLAAPERYEPAYGGWCAYAMASNDKTEANPESFLIENGRLLVFYDGFWGDTRKSWLKETGSKLRPKADSRWKGFSKETAPPRRVGVSAGGGCGLHRHGSPLRPFRYTRRGRAHPRPRARWGHLCVQGRGVASGHARGPDTPHGAVRRVVCCLPRRGQASRAGPRGVDPGGSRDPALQLGEAP